MRIARDGFGRALTLLVLDIVYVLGVIALVAVIALIARGVERL